MGYARYVGRVGGLAVALGVGVAVASTPGVAWAEPTDTGSSSSSTDSSSSGSSSSGSGESSQTSESSGVDDADTRGDTAAPLVESKDADSGVTSKKSTDGVKKKSGSDSSAASVTPKKPKKKVTPTQADSDTSKSEPVADTTAATQPKSQPVTSPTVNQPSTIDMATQSTPLSTSTVQDVPKVESAPEPESTPLASTVLSAVGLAPSADGDAPEVPGDSPLLLAGLAAFRRQTQQASVEDEALTKTAADPSQSSLLMAAVVANSVPTASPVVGSPEQSTGAVSVKLNAVDADGNPLTYSVTGQPVNGTLRVDGAGAYTYTPTQAARLAAGSTTQPDFDSFTVSVADGAGGVTPVTVSVPVLPAVWANQASSSNVTGASPYGVAVVGNTAYVTNQGTNTVSVINTLTGQSIGAPIVVGSAPTGAVASLDGAYVFVSNRNSGTVSVIRTADNKVVDINPATPTTVDAIKVGSQPEWMAINTSDITTPTGVVNKGTRLYVANYGSGTVSVVDISNPAAPKVIDVNPTTTTTIDAIKVGINPRSIGFAQTPSGPRLYVVNRGSGTVSVIDAVTNKAIDLNPATTTTIDAIKVGSAPQQIAISPDGTRAYVTNYSSNSVSVINTATNAVDGTAISVPSTPIGVALSNDGGLLYVANGNDKVSVINTKTRTIINTVQIDSTPETNYHTMTVRSDGALIVTDMADKALRVVTYQRGNTAPVAIANPSVGATNPNNGAITGSVNIKDWDGDPLTYTTVSGPTRGTVSFNAVAGTYTYTPTQAARDAAAQNSGLTDTFTIRATTDPNGAYKDTTPITVTILPSGTNHAPVLQGDPTYVVDLNTGRVSGSFRVTDVDGDLLSYSYTEPAGGDVMVFGSSGPATSYTYDFIVYMSEEAREQAAQTVGPDTYTFTVTLSDGQTWTHVPVSVPIEPRPTDMPVWQGPTTTTYDPYTGRTTGNMNVIDPDGDPLTYGTTYGPWYGTLTIDQATGNYVYVPYLNADQGVSSYEIVTVSVNDGSYVTYHDWWVQTYRDDLAPM